MGELDPSIPQVNDPELEADLIRVLSVVGRVGKLRVADIVIPTVSLGNVVQQTVEVRQPAFTSSNIFSAGAQVAAAINTVHADTTALAAGTYDVKIIIRAGAALFAMVFQVQHRNAANTANLAQWDFVPEGDNGSILVANETFGYELGLNERIRILNLTAMTAGRASVATIFARRRT